MSEPELPQASAVFPRVFVEALLLRKEQLYNYENPKVGSTWLRDDSLHSGPRSTRADGHYDVWREHG
jgi:hypothetical protein